MSVFAELAATVRVVLPSKGSAQTTVMALPEEWADALAALDLIEQRAEEMLENPVSWREQTFRLRMEEAEQRATDMEKALNVIEAVAYEGKAGVISETDALRTIQADCSAALSAREEAQP